MPLMLPFCIWVGESPLYRKLIRKIKFISDAFLILGVYQGVRDAG